MALDKCYRVRRISDGLPQMGEVVLGIVYEWGYSCGCWMVRTAPHEFMEFDTGRYIKPRYWTFIDWDERARKAAAQEKVRSLAIKNCPKRTFAE